MGPSPGAGAPVGAAKPALCTLPWAPALSAAASQLSLETGETAGEGSPSSLQHRGWFLCCSQSTAELQGRQLSALPTLHRAFPEHPLLQESSRCFPPFSSLKKKKLFKNESDFNKWGKLDYSLLEISQEGDIDFPTLGGPDLMSSCGSR